MNNIKNKITWISSYPKSGNTWIRSLITAYINNGQLDINKIMPLNDKSPFYYENIIDQPISEWNMLEQALLKPAAMLKMLREAEANLMLKTHDCNVQMSGVSQIPPDITLSCIYIVRDPRDVVLSMKNHYGFEDNNEAVSNMLDDGFITRSREKGLFYPQLSWKIHVTSWMRELPYPVYIVKYEDLLEKPVEIFSEIIEFLDFKYNKTLIRNTVDACAFENMKRQEIKNGFKEGVGKQFFYKGQAQRWKTDLELELQEKIVNVLQPEMKSLGYI